MDSVTSQALSYPTHRSGLTVSGYKGVLDRGFSSCAVPAFFHGPGILNCMQVFIFIFFISFYRPRGRAHDGRMAVGT